MCDTYLKSAKKTTVGWQRRRSSVFVANFENILHSALVYNLEKVNAGFKVCVSGCNRNNYQEL